MRKEVKEGKGIKGKEKMGKGIRESEGKGKGKGKGKRKGKSRKGRKGFLLCSQKCRFFW